MDKQKDSLYLPYRMIIEKITDEAPGVRTFRLKFKEEREGEDFHFKAGQFGEYSAFGEGESTFCIASSPTRKGYIADHSAIRFLWMNGKERIFCS